MTDSITRQIADLHNLSHSELQSLWTTLYGTNPPAYNKAHLIRRLAYRLQELTYGGLSEGAKSKMRAILETSGLDENAGEPKRRRKSAAKRHDTPVAGTRLVREWNGRQYEVTCVHGGYEYEGRLYRSLTAVTKAITGTHWNGRAFWGLQSNVTRRRKRKVTAVEI
ncbi:MAG: DUF2924 domain-containing protein [Armatimonadetes bacterium]|nr:DUF2924 domain-containing protein [Armatimonadota bacterium]